MSKRLFLILASVIIGFAAVARVLWLDSVPVSLYWDESAILADARAIVLTGSDLHGESIFKPIYYSYGDYKMPVYIIFTAVMTAIVGANELAVRIPNVIIGLLTMVTAGYLARKLFGNEGSDQSKILLLITLFILALIPWHFHFSRIGFEAFTGQFFVLLSVAVLFSSLPEKLKYALAPLLGAIGVYSYFSVRFIWPVVFILAILAYYWQHKQVKSVKSLVVGSLISLIIFAIALIPLVTSSKYQPSNQFRYSTPSLMQNEAIVLQSNLYREIAGNTPIDRVFFHRELLRAQALGINFSEHLSGNFIFLTGDSNLRHGTGNHGLFLLSMAPLLLIGLVQLFRKKTQIFILLVGWWFVSLVPAAVPLTVPHALRSLNALVPLALIISFGMYYLYRYAKYHLEGKAFIMVVSISTAVLLAEFGFFLFHYFGSYPALSADDWQSGHKEVVSAVYKHKTAAPTYIYSTDDRLYLWFLAFGPYSGEQFTDWQDELQEDEIAFDNIVFGAEPNLETVASGSVIVTNADKVEETLEQVHTANRQVKETELIVDSMQQEQFVLVVIE